MSEISSKLRKWFNDSNGDDGLVYWCQGCESTHSIKVKGQGAWSWNQDDQKPVFGPSVLYQSNTWTPPVTPENMEQYRAAPWTQTQTKHICHTFIGCNGAQPGEVIFLSDCTHSLAGTVQPFPELPDWLRGDK